MNKQRPATYSDAEYMDDLRRLEEQQLTFAQKRAHRTAIRKRYKAAIVINNLHEIAAKENLDLTPTMASQIINAWLGRGITRELLNAHFGTPGRTASEKSEDFVRAERIALEYRDGVIQEIAQRMSDGAD